MKTEDVELNVKEIFEKKKIPYQPADVAQARYIAKEVICYLLELERRRLK